MAEKLTTYHPATALSDDSEIAHSAGLAREQLNRSFSANGNPTLAVMQALGVELSAKEATAA